MPNLVTNLRQGLSAARSSLHRRRAKAILALLGLAVLAWLVWPFVSLIGHGQEVVALLQLAPEVLGLNGPKTYLILVQNEDELRPTGGYITAAGTATVHFGRITNLSIEDVFAIDDLKLNYPLPPEPLQEYMNAHIWLLRDSNWSPDFPTSAALAQAFYMATRPKKIDGVVAFDQASLRIMLEATGPVAVKGFPTRITSGNLDQVLRAAREPGPGQTVSYDWWLHRKDFMPAVAAALLRRVVWANWGSLLHGALRALNERHLLIILTDPPAAAILAQHGWDGRLQPGPGDYLMFVEANVGFNKVNADEQTRLSYAVDLSASARPTALLTISQSNPADSQLPCQPGPSYGSGRYADLIARCYWSYDRVYTPRGTDLLAATPHDEQADWMIRGQPVTGTVTVASGENGTQSFGTLVVVPFSTTITTTFQYALAPGALTLDAGATTYTYVLRLQKQPGTGALPVTLSARLPAGARILAAPPGGRQQGDTWQIDLGLREDMNLQLRFSRP